ncbi:hypothetical protein HGRIS_008953 [Hohenbuehelia grisea]|uniref:F-box domain-containing protein n=1 Tax=Hohenbuehelia grisea TaxID=104357 RepID=A0ABR3IZR4_9AGAR
MPYPKLLDRDLSTQLMSYLSPVDISRYRRVSLSSRDAVKAFNNVAYDLERALAPFLSSSEYTVLRDIQEILGVVISGSQIVNFFDRAASDLDSDLEVYVEFKHAKLLGEWLESIGYQFQPRGPQAKSFSECYALKRTHEDSSVHDQPMLASTINIANAQPNAHQYSSQDIRDVFNFARSSGGRTLNIQLIATVYAPAQAILRFHSTVVMNVVTARCAYALLPVSTFHARQLVKSLNVNENAQSKYVDRGWSMVLTEEVVEGRAAVDAKIRFFGDQYCWTVPLPLPRAAVTFSQPHSVDTIIVNSWANKYSEGLFNPAYKTVKSRHLVRTFTIWRNDLWWGLFHPLFQAFLPGKTGTNGLGRRPSAIHTPAHLENVLAGCVKAIMRPTASTRDDLTDWMVKNYINPTVALNVATSIWGELFSAGRVVYAE